MCSGDCRRLDPVLVAVDRGTLRGVVVVDRPTNELSHIPVGVEQRRVRDDDVASNAFDLLRVPERKRVVVADGDEHTVRLDGVEHVGRDVARRLVSRPRRGAGVAEQRNEREQRHGRREQPAPSSAEPAVAASRRSPLRRTSCATDSQTYIRPTAAHTPHAEKLQRKK